MGFSKEWNPEEFDVRVKLVEEEEREEEERKEEEEVDVLIVGGNCGGLSVGGALSKLKSKKDDLKVVVVEKGEGPGSMWGGERYENLHLHDIADLCSLPFVGLPPHLPQWVILLIIYNPSTWINDRSQGTALPLIWRSM